MNRDPQSIRFEEMQSEIKVRKDVKIKDISNIYMHWLIGKCYNNMIEFNVNKCNSRTEKNILALFDRKYMHMDEIKTMPFQPLASNCYSTLLFLTDKLFHSV